MFYHEEKDIRAAVHGDDFTVLGDSEDLDWFRGQISGRYSVKFRGRLGPRSTYGKYIRILNMIVQWNEDQSLMNRIRYMPKSSSIS